MNWNVQVSYFRDTHRLREKSFFFFGGGGTLELRKKHIFFSWYALGRYFIADALGTMEKRSSQDELGSLPLIRPLKVNIITIKYTTDVPRPSYVTGRFKHAVIIILSISLVQYPFYRHTVLEISARIRRNPNGRVRIFENDHVGPRNSRLENTPPPHTRTHTHARVKIEKRVSGRLRGADPEVCPR